MLLLHPVVGVRNFVAELARLAADCLTRQERRVRLRWGVDGVWLGYVFGVRGARYCRWPCWRVRELRGMHCKQ